MWRVFQAALIYDLLLNYKYSLPSLNVFHMVGLMRLNLGLTDTHFFFTGECICDEKKRTADVT